uniref:Large ribosomal subunit protein bL32c n=12 Tax=Bambusinae TaxID=1648004 RepID=A0A6B9UDR0_9POAL|nr:ribosomal protein L32 [Dendrocalamus ovatus]YP_009928875.1 ribosomal protein L32 [Dendrocalamus sikkimensis]YP_009928957.1 ribosomal protein L32 [Dendrocalamus yunnanicus]YP_010390177.1 ribosomal protein L32 [Dendrocalamus farinosus]QFQ33624.1 ribosomal protein L32 [Bambusa variostriata]QJW32249.1 ribosomal protein L32 [Dendrocalamus minor var. amoenus]QXL58671.1 50S ribosomal protein L32 [Bambusa beecheyana var. pubescens]UIX54505.1 ribosomal protein L32 [Dendrocalamus latiflorus]QHN598
MAVPKKRTSMSKKRIRKNLWKKKTHFSIVQSYSLAKSRSFSSGSEHPKPKGFSGQQTNNLVLE